MKKALIAIVFLAIIVVIMVIVFKKPTTSTNNTSEQNQISQENFNNQQNQDINNQNNTVNPDNNALPTGDVTKVTLRTNKGNIELDLYSGLAPRTAGNFIELAKSGYYNGTRFHRVIPNFMIQGGDTLSKDINNKDKWGTGGPGYMFDDEFVPGLSNVTGTISMANRGPNTNGSQFFINVNDNVNLDYDKEPLASKHAVFGEVTSGMDIVMSISTTATDQFDRPLEDVIIQSVLIAE